MKPKYWNSAIVVLSLLAVGMQPALGTKFIPTDASIGDWDSVNRIYTLTTDVYETIQIDEDNLTFDGAGYTVTAAPSLTGIYVPVRTGVTIENVNVQGCDTGIYLFSGSGNTVTNNTASNNYIGIYFSYSSNSTVTNNTASANGVGIWLWRSSNSLVANNTALDNYGGGIYHYRSHYSTIRDNTAFDNNVAMSLWTAHNNTVTGNTCSNNRLGAAIWYSNDNLIYNNNFIDNIRQALDNYGAGNVFNLPAPIGGNYWSDWCPPLHPDDDGDGFVDKPYVFDGGQDNLPLVSTPAQAIDGLIGIVEDMNLQQGIANALDAKLDAVSKVLDDVNENNDVAAIGALGAFINAVEAQRGKQLTDAQADELVSHANWIIATLSG